MRDAIAIIDDFLPDAKATRAAGLAAPFIDWQAPDGETYRRVSIGEIPGLQDAIERAVGPVDMHGMGFRLNFGGELPNACIHSDIGWGTHALVLYLSEPVDGSQSGTAFWTHRATGAHRMRPDDFGLLDAVQDDWNDERSWEPRAIVGVKFNRGVIYESEQFHSRYPFAAFGDGPDTGRLVAVAFFTPVAA